MGTRNDIGRIKHGNSVISVNWGFTRKISGIDRGSEERQSVGDWNKLHFI